ncbi:NADH dehydrogenase subunit N [Longilinea arvoryzae]|uniref:NADH-quinone oxidoreductase subunit N n=1 Tax=Longilinea arvoryzae TaxID=360412 RepID=A0A0S7BLA3_9CHLR|nr:NADH-quinone oxidoreductase subunit N [Longilinea arvoryzae]GAP15892.1 NADH dehydrogenase subunit N [Longilinea arvoryzae]
MTLNLDDLYTILPVLVTAGWAVALLLVDLFIPEKHKGWIALLAVLGLGADLGLTLAMRGRSQTAFNGMAVLDGFTVFLDVIILSAGMAGIALAYDYLKRMKIERGEYYVLLLFSISGMLLMAQAYDLIIVFLALELLSIPLYVLTGFARPRSESEESALKYFFLGALASAFLLYGVALIFAATAHTDLVGIQHAFVDSSRPVNLALFAAGAAMALVGLGFKVAAVPFHMWTPDVYQGAPTPVTGFMAVAVKAAGFAALLRVFLTIFPGLSAQLTPILWTMAVLTMLVGNLLAIAQNNIKRLLAYSSIANAGYLLMAFVPYGNGEVAGNSLAAMLFYLVAYGLTSFGAWAVVTAMEGAEGRGLDLNDYAGLGRKYPWLAVCMLVFMLSFAGVPLTLGFWGKFYLFSAAVQAGFISLALIGLLTSVLSAYYYLRVVVIMFMRPGEPVVRRDAALSLVTLVSAVAVVGLAFVPNTLLELARQALMRLL